ncbi:MAG: MGH1-like glycoside hydrolase domain-containing protein [Candidatus Limnocylindrales bacterium]
MSDAHPDPERQRLAERDAGTAHWDRWGPYLSSRQWGTVREDYSADGQPWTYLPHDQARSRAYRWGEDGLLGLSDDHGRLCFAVALWNEHDPILKERPFGLSGPEGNHGEDVKELYWFLDGTPSHSYLKAAYAYPQAAFPYADLIAENARRTRQDDEYELVDTGAFADQRWFDVGVEYAKAGPDDILVRIRVTNMGPETAPIQLLPTLWFRNAWSWGRGGNRPRLSPVPGDAPQAIRGEDERLGQIRLDIDRAGELLFTENESNAERLWGTANAQPFVKDAFHRFVVDAETGAVNPERVGSKAASRHRFVLAAGASEVLRLRLRLGPADPLAADPGDPFDGFETTFEDRIAEADAFYAGFGGEDLSDDERLVQRQAFAGLIWCKQFYHYDVDEWLDGDPALPPPPDSRRVGRNADWRELNTRDIISMPDNWEYPWFAAWDLAFHAVTLALIDPSFAKAQLLLLTREWYMQPNGQLPAYEWRFGDVNPPVHAWAAWRVYQIERRLTGQGDLGFLERIFHKLLLNFTWWVNRKDIEGANVFQGGFLGLDNIGLFDRDAPLPGGAHLGQADGTAWMGMFCLNMLSIAIELAHHDIVYEDIATKFFEHFLYIAGALNNLGGKGISLWDEQDSFYYDVIHYDSGESIPLRVRSLVGLIPLLAVQVLEPEVIEDLPGFRRRMNWFLDNRPELARNVTSWTEPGVGRRRLLSLVHDDHLQAVIRRIVDPDEFLSPHGIRSLSREHLAHPVSLTLPGGTSSMIDYEPAESRSDLFGGNSNWRGPVWFPMNYLLIEAFLTFHHYQGDTFRVEMPAGSGHFRELDELAWDLSDRLAGLFLRDANGLRPVLGPNARLQPDPAWIDRIPFYEYFDGDNGRGAGASHQTGWTALIAKLLDQTARRRRSEGDADDPAG